MQRFVLFFLLLNLVSISPKAWGQTQWKTTHYLNMAREALALGAMDKWKRALQQADQVFATEGQKMSFSERNNQKLWLTLFWSKYYQFRGTLPPIKQVRDFESSADVQQHIEKTNQSIRYLKKGLKYLRSYNLMYMQVTKRSNLQNQIYLQASLSLERDLEGTLRQGQIYRALLQYIQQNWRQNSKVQSHLKAQNAKIETILQSVMARSQKQLSIEARQRKLALVVERAQDGYTELNSQIRSRSTTAQVLIWSGSLIAIAGLGTGVWGFFTYQEHYITEGRSADKREEIRLRGIILMASGGGGLLLGTILIIVGAAINPPAQANNRAVVRSHNTYINSERKKQPSISLFPTLGGSPSGM